MAAFLIGDDALGVRLLTANEARAREQGALAELPQLLILRAVWESEAGRFASAAAAADEGASMAAESGQRAPFAACRAHLAVAAAIRGDAELATAAAAEASAIASELGIGLAMSVAAYAGALVHLGAGREEAALTALAAIEHPILMPFRSMDECEALVRLGRLAEAAAPLSRLAAIADATRTPVNQARLERCRGLLAEGGGEEHFQRALELHGERQSFERARTLLAYGEALRRARRRTDARTPLRGALDAFERMGAQPWAARAGGELRASGETARRRDPSAVDQLTPQELAISQLVARGLSNREIAACLFLSPRTVEYHLHKVFPKLGIASRVELAKLELGVEARVEAATV